MLHSFHENYMDAQALQEKNSKINDYVELVYGQYGAQLSLNHIFSIEQLLQTLAQTCLSDAEIAKAFIMLLCKQNNKLHLPVKISRHLLQHAYPISRTCSYYPSKKAFEIAEQILQYIHIEQQFIFTHPRATYIFFQHIDRQKQKTSSYQLPLLLNFWSTEQARQKLRQIMTPHDAVIQFMSWKAIGDMATDMAIMMATMQGASLANAQISKEGLVLAEIIDKNSQSTQTTLKNFQQNAQKQQEVQMQSLMNAFTKAQQTVQEDIQNAASLSNLELDYLYQNISVEQPQQNYIFNQIPYDQLFALGIMNTPQGPIWNNPFCVGDWQYDAHHNSFWQNQISAIYHEITTDQGTTEKSAMQSENNSIYAEYYSNNNNYVIEGSMTFYAVEYPFFAGILFNKSRWISGDFESIRKSRLIGIYGNEQKQIGIYFAEQYTMTDEQIKASPSDSPIQTPLQQILQNTIKPSVLLPDALFKNIHNNPITFNFTIRTTPQAVFFKFWNQFGSSKEITITHLDHLMFMYHGIGFMSPGAAVEFTLSKPTDFIFSDNAIMKYKEQL